MLLTTPAFERYVDAARTGRTALWRTVLIAAVALVLPWVIGIGSGLLAAVAAGIVDFSGGLSGAEFDRLLTGPATAALGLGTVALTCTILWALVRLLQRRPLATVLGVGSRLCGGVSSRGAAAVALAPGVV